jgi:hypothetical protein
MAAVHEILVSALRDPARLAAADLQEWNQLLPAARGIGVWGSLATRLFDLGLVDQLPPRVQPHIEGALVLAARHSAVMRWEVNRIEAALADVPTPIVLLKGAAYLMAGLEPSRGRMFSDVDILVPENRLTDVEHALRQAGWVAGEIDPRNERYFRTWLHELPPLMHRRRATTLDVHHTILPRTDRLQVDPELLFQEAVPAANSRSLVFSPADMVLHSAAHLFRNGRFTHGLRDLWDLDLLLKTFAGQPGFWSRLLDRALQLNLRLPCFCGLRYAELFFGTSVPDEVKRSTWAWRPRWPNVRLLDVVVRRACRPPAHMAHDRLRGASQTLLSHWPVPRLRAMTTTLFWTKRLPHPAEA